MRKLTLSLLLVFVFTLSACTKEEEPFVPVIDCDIYPSHKDCTEEPDPIESPDFVTKLLASMTLAEKAAQMVQAERDSNKMLTWILRGVGFVCMIIGICLFLNPLAVIIDFIPFLGGIAETGIFLVALLISIPLTSLTIAMAWIFYRPMVGIPLIVLAIGSIIALFVIKGKKRAQAR